MRVLVALLLVALVAGPAAAAVSFPVGDPAAPAPEAKNSDVKLPWTVSPPAPAQVPPGADRLADDKKQPSSGDAATGKPLDAQDPYQALLGSLARQPGASPAQIASSVASYFRGLGYSVPPVAGDPVFDENTTIYYSYDLPDVSGDGVADILLDEYCVSLDTCRSTFSTTSPDSVNKVEYYRCGWPHRLSAVSSVDGQMVWNRSLNAKLNLLGVVPYTYQLACSFDFVVGQVPLANGTRGVLVYEYGVYRPIDVVTVRLIQNRFLLLSAVTGGTIWQKEIMGYYQDSFVGGSVPKSWHTSNFVVNPILQQPRRDWMPADNPNLVPTLLAQGVGFNMTFVDSVTAPPGFTRPLPIVERYDPIEWAARWDPDSGRESWRVDTFMPHADRSILPVVLQTPPYPTGVQTAINAGGTEPASTAINYWSAASCCGDVNGDGIADLAYRTYEWYPMPEANSNGPHWLEGHVALFDGATGKPVYNLVAEPAARETILNEYWLNVERTFRILVQGLGDVNNDGKSDFAVHVIHDYLDGFSQNTTIRNGPDGAELWRLDSPRAMALMPIGQATDDGADFLVVDWFAVSATYFANSYSYTNVTQTPLAVLNGKDGALLWKSSTFAAPVDLVFMMETARLNGLPDLNRDGVGDFPTDDPLQLPDLTIVHRLAFVSGRDGTTLYRVSTVGAFAFPARVADVTGDGLDDLGILNGDITDLWLTVTDAAKGETLWSIRVLSPRTSTYTFATPRMRFHAIADAARPQQDFVLNFQLNTYTTGFFYGVYSTTPVLGAYQGANGTIYWTIPHNLPADVGFVKGASPQTAQYRYAFEEPLQAFGAVSPHARINLVPAAASLGAGFLLAFALTRWRMKP